MKNRMRIHPFLQIILVQNSQRSNELNQFCSPNSNDDLCLLFYLYPSSMLSAQGRQKNHNDNVCGFVLAKLEKTVLVLPMSGPLRNLSDSGNPVLKKHQLFPTLRTISEMESFKVVKLGYLPAFTRTFYQWWALFRYNVTPVTYVVQLHYRSKKKWTEKETPILHQFSLWNPGFCTFLLSPRCKKFENSTQKLE